MYSLQLGHSVQRRKSNQTFSNIADLARAWLDPIGYSSSTCALLARITRTTWATLRRMHGHTRAINHLNVTHDLLIYTITADDGTLLRELGAAASNVESCTIADEGVLLSELCTAANNASLPVSNNTQPKPKAIICFHCKQTLPSDEDSLSKHCEECSSMARPNPLTYKFVCFGCNYYTYCRRIITNHYRKHTGRKPFKCVVCKQFFATYGGAYQHLRRTHGQESCSSLKALRKPRGPKPKPDSTRSLRKKK
ncbi:hypothetical protein M8J76_008322 [Diaphorina citri]|nr:hypothetical protein M8J76_008322 [Diaphorina citri]